MGGRAGVKCYWRGNLGHCPRNCPSVAAEGSGKGSDSPIPAWCRYHRFWQDMDCGILELRDVGVQSLMSKLPSGDYEASVMDISPKGWYVAERVQKDRSPRRRAQCAPFQRLCGACRCVEPTLHRRRKDFVWFSTT